MVCEHFCLKQLKSFRTKLIMTIINVSNIIHSILMILLEKIPIFFLKNRQFSMKIHSPGNIHIRKFPGDGESKFGKFTGESGTGSPGNKP